MESAGPARAPAADGLYRMRVPARSAAVATIADLYREGWELVSTDLGLEEDGVVTLTLRPLSVGGD
jgi:hypothetical protein